MLASGVVAQGFALIPTPATADFGNKLVGSSTVQPVALGNLSKAGSTFVNLSQLAAPALAAPVEVIITSGRHLPYEASSVIKWRTRCRVLRYRNNTLSQ